MLKEKVNREYLSQKEDYPNKTRIYSEEEIFYRMFNLPKKQMTPQEREYIRRNNEIENGPT